MSRESNLLRYHDEHSLLLVNPAGHLRKLVVPFKVVCIIPVGKIKSGTGLYVDAVAWHHEHRILYRILNEWQPYRHFKLVLGSY